MNLTDAIKRLTVRSFNNSFSRYGDYRKIMCPSCKKLRDNRADNWRFAGLDNNGEDLLVCKDCVGSGYMSYSADTILVLKKSQSNAFMKYSLINAKVYYRPQFSQNWPSSNHVE